MTLWTSIVVFAGTLILILVRPRGLNEAAGATIGAFAALALRVVPLADLRTIIQDTANVLLFLLGMMIVTGAVEDAGVFDYFAAMAARSARGSGHILLLNVFILGAITTAFLSLDVTIIVLTPIVFVIVDRLELDPVPYLFACAFVANTASLFLPISNLTNILMFDLLHLSFTRFVQIMFLPNLAALVVNIGVFFILFRARIPRRFSSERLDGYVRQRDLGPALALLITTLAGLFICGIIGIALAVPALIGAGVLLLRVFLRRSATITQATGYVAWSLFPFVLAMFVVIHGVERAWFSHITKIPTGTDFGTLFAVTVGVSIGANIVNNIPMVLGMINLIRTITPPAEPFAFATLIGTNIGPSILTIGSLATLLWLAIVQKRGVAVTAFAYMRVGVITTPLMLLGATLVLWLQLSVFHW